MPDDDGHEEEKSFLKSNPQRHIRACIDTRELIDLVRQKRCLWDRTDPGYRERLAKDKAWKEIYTELEPSYPSMKPALKHELGLHITKKWYNVRDSYVKSKRSSRSSRPYLYNEAMSFLDPVIFGEASNSRNEDRTYNEEIENEARAEESENWLNEVFIDVDESMTNEVPNKIPKLEFSKSREELEENETNIVTVLANLIQKEEDDDRAFFKSITPSVKMLSPEAKLEFRIQVLKLLKNLRTRGTKRIMKKEKSSLYESDSE